MKPGLSQAPLSPAVQLSLPERIRIGDPSAETELVHVYGKRIYLLGLARVRDAEAARDLVQEVLIAVLQALRNGQLRNAERLPAYVLGTARNLVNNYLRARSNQPNYVPISPELSITAFLEQVDEAEQMQLMNQALERLGVAERKILLMTLVEGLKPGDIANQLGLSAEVVRTRKSRAIKKMSEYIQKSRHEHRGRYH